MGLGPVSPKMLLAPLLKLIHAQVVRQLPAGITQVVRGVFREEAGRSNILQVKQVFISNSLIVSCFLYPCFDQTLPRAKFTVKTVRPGRIFAADLQLASTFDKTVGNPALESRVIASESAGCQIKGIAIRYAISGIYPVIAGEQQQAYEKQSKSHN